MTEKEAEEEIPPMHDLFTKVLTHKDLSKVIFIYDLLTSHSSKDLIILISLTILIEIIEI